MKTRYKNYTIEDDRNGFILSVHWIYEKWENIGQEYIKEQVYPSTFENCLKSIMKYEKNNKWEVETLQAYIDEYKKMQEEFLSDLKTIINE